MTLAGIGIDDMDEADVVTHIVSELSAGRGGWVSTPNVDILRQAAADDDLRALVESADLVILDGMPLVWASRLRRTPLTLRVAASALVYPLCRALAQRGLRLYLLGAEPEVARDAEEVLRTAAPGLVVAGAASPAVGGWSGQPWAFRRGNALGGGYRGPPAGTPGPGHAK